jgi:hypothetical protein
MPACYTIRLQLNFLEEPQVLRQELLNLCREGRIDEVMLMMFLNERNNGHETLAEIRDWLDALRPYKQLLESEGIQVSLNPGHVFMQCDRGRKLKPHQDWQTMVDWKGRTAAAVVCPLDPGWQAYFLQVLALYAAENYRVIWLEDDVRFANHAPLDWGGCFCPLHVAEFNRRAGVEASREQIVRNILCPGLPHPWRKIWLDMWDETQTGLASTWREVAGRYGAKLGLMSSGPEMHAMEGRHWQRWWQALSGDTPPIHRPHFTGYGDALGHALPGAIVMLDLNRSIEPPGTEIGPEIENSPHGWAKSYRQTAAAMTLAQVAGASRLNISPYDYPGNRPGDTPQTAAFLSDWKETLSWLAELFPPTLASYGVGCPWDQEMSYRKQTDAGEQWMELHCRTGGWAAWLGGFGHAFQMRKNELLNALAGDMAWAFTEEDIFWMLARGLLLDGPAAEILARRGFDRYIGLSELRFVSQKEVLYVLEQTLDPEFGLRPEALISVNDRPSTKKLLQGRLLGGARAISVLLDPKHRVVGHGVTLYENELGGRVAVCPWDTNTTEVYNGQRNVQRAAQIRTIVEYLTRGVSLGSAAGSPWLVPQFFTDGNTWRGLVWNAYPDEIRRFAVRLPAGMEGASQVVQVDAHGARTTAEWKDGWVYLPRPLHQWEYVILS